MFLFFTPIKWAIKLVVLAAFAAAVYLIVSGVQVVRASGGAAETAYAGSAAIVVTDSGSNTATNLSPDLVARLQQTIALYRAHFAPSIIVAGPLPSGGQRGVPEVAKSWLEERGVSAAAITTVLSANASEFGAVARLLPANSHRVIVVTDALDVLWAQGAANVAGLQASTSAVPSSKRPFTSELGPLFREASGVAAGRVIGYDHTTWAAS